MSLGKNKLLDYLTNDQCLDKTVVSWIQRTGFDNVAAFVQAFSLPTMDLIGVSGALYLPDKSVLGKRTDGIIMFEKAVARFISIDEIKKYSDGVFTTKEEFELLPGHIIGLQLTATEMRHNHKNESFVNSSQPTKTPFEFEDVQNFTPIQNGHNSIRKVSDFGEVEDVIIEEYREEPLIQDPIRPENYLLQLARTRKGVRVPLDENDPDQARESILIKLRRNLNEKNIIIESEDIIFKDSGAFVSCPNCRKRVKIVSRNKNKNGGDMRYEVYDACHHIIGCTEGTIKSKRPIDLTVEDDSSNETSDINENEAREWIFTKLKRKLLDDNIEIQPEDIVFKNSEIHLCCPSCYRLFKVLDSAKNKNRHLQSGIDEVCGHVVGCSSGIIPKFSKGREKVEEVYSNYDLEKREEAHKLILAKLRWKLDKHKIAVESQNIIFGPSGIFVSCPNCDKLLKVTVRKRLMKDGSLRCEVYDAGMHIIKCVSGVWSKSDSPVNKKRRLNTWDNEDSSSTLDSSSIQKNIKNDTEKDINEPLNDQN